MHLYVPVIFRWQTAEICDKFHLPSSLCIDFFFVAPTTLSVNYTCSSEHSTCTLPTTAFLPRLLVTYHTSTQCEMFAIFISKPYLLRMCFFLHWKVTVVQMQHRPHRRREQGRVLGLTPCDTLCRKRSYTNSCQESELASNGQPMFEFEGPKDTIILIFSNSCLCSDIAIA